jgi:hypothetical protein
MEDTKSKETLQGAVQRLRKVGEAIERIADCNPVQNQHQIDLHEQGHVLAAECNQVEPNEHPGDGESVFVVLPE